MHTSGTGERGIYFSVFQQFYFSVYISPGLRGGGTSDSLLTVAVLLVYAQAEREGGGALIYICVCFSTCSAVFFAVRFRPCISSCTLPTLSEDEDRQWLYILCKAHPKGKHERNAHFKYKDGKMQAIGLGNERR